MLLVIHQLAIEPQLSCKMVQSVTTLLLAPLQHLWLRPLDLLLSSTIQVPVYLFPQNTNCLMSIHQTLSKRLSNPLYYHSFTSWSGWPAVWLPHPSLRRQQNWALIKISWLWMLPIKTTSWLSRLTSHEHVGFHGTLLLHKLRIVHGIIPTTSEFAYKNWNLSQRRYYLLLQDPHLRILSSCLLEK